MSRQQFQRTGTCTSSYCAENHMCHAPECNFALKSEVPQCRAQLHVEQIMLLHSLVAHSRRQSIMFHAGESHDGTALKSTVHCRPMERCARPPRTACPCRPPSVSALCPSQRASSSGMEESKAQPLELVWRKSRCQITRTIDARDMTRPDFAIPCSALQDPLRFFSAILPKPTY